MKKKKNKNLNQIRKVIKKYKESNSPTDKLDKEKISGVNTKHPNSPSDRISKTFRNHSNKYKTIMGQTWGDKK